MTAKFAKYNTGNEIIDSLQVLQQEALAACDHDSRTAFLIRGLATIPVGLLVGQRLTVQSDMTFATDSILKATERRLITDSLEFVGEVHGQLGYMVLGQLGVESLMLKFVDSRLLTRHGIDVLNTNTSSKPAGIAVTGAVLDVPVLAVTYAQGGGGW